MSERLGNPFNLRVNFEVPNLCYQYIKVKRNTTDFPEIADATFRKRDFFADILMRRHKKFKNKINSFKKTLVVNNAAYIFRFD